jgi:hypothetical protein
MRKRRRDAKVATVATQRPQEVVPRRKTKFQRGYRLIGIST